MKTIYVVNTRAGEDDVPIRITWRLQSVYPKFRIKFLAKHIDYGIRVMEEFIRHPWESSFWIWIDTFSGVFFYGSDYFAKNTCEPQKGPRFIKLHKIVTEKDAQKVIEELKKIKYLTFSLNIR